MGEAVTVAALLRRAREQNWPGPVADLDAFDDEPPALVRRYVLPPDEAEGKHSMAENTAGQTGPSNEEQAAQAEKAAQAKAQAKAQAEQAERARIARMASFLQAEPPGRR